MPQMRRHTAGRKRNARAPSFPGLQIFHRQGRMREAFETYVAPDYIQHNPA